MKRFFSPNIGGKGRLMRGLASVTLFIGAGFAFASRPWLGVILAAAGIFVLIEALRGWCVVRACGVKTRW
jgi:hypothetical protein